ncbi:MAG: hypothetical protein HY929_08350 [Euryarchaeota archaeon]|nr:hypothetical protein [Euryarchaeota archaeon]
MTNKSDIEELENLILELEDSVKQLIDALAQQSPQLLAYFEDLLIKARLPYRKILRTDLENALSKGEIEMLLSNIDHLALMAHLNYRENRLALLPELLTLMQKDIKTCLEIIKSQK